MTPGERLDAALWWLSRRLRPVLHPRLWRQSTRAVREHAARQARYDAYVASLPAFDHPPAGLDVSVIQAGGAFRLDLTQAVPGRYRFPIPGFAEPMNLTVVGEDAPQ